MVIFIVETKHRQLMAFDPPPHPFVHMFLELPTPKTSRDRIGNYIALGLQTYHFVLCGLLVSSSSRGIDGQLTLTLKRLAESMLK